ncbi:MAG: ATP phosphoribosyltransferase regulatory subunit [Pseudomonadota bacterium]
MSLTQNALEALAPFGADRVDPPISIEAKVPLELSGEAVRSRICTFIDQAGLEWALRPDLTLAVAQAEVAARRGGETGETVRSYCGPIFRLPARASDPLEYTQVGLERFDAPRGPDQDVWLFSALSSVSQACGLETGQASFGDLSIFPSFVDALGFSADTAAGLKRAFRQAGGVKAFLEGQVRSPQGLTGRLTGMSRVDVSAFVDDIYAMTGVRPVGERGADEIVERLFERAQATAQAVVSDAQANVLEALLAVDVPLQDAADALRQIAQNAGLSQLEPVLTAFATRAEGLLSSGEVGVLKAARFATQFGRRFTYYDGFVFEIFGEDPSIGPFAAGGRYDSLLRDLSGGAVDATALGGVVVPHRMAQLTGAAK